MSDVAKSYGVGDTVYVWFKDSNTLNKLPNERVVADVRTLDASNTAEVTFTTGEKTLDGLTTAKRVFETQAACAAAIIDAVISDYTPCVALDTTTSGASTSGQVATTLVRKN